MALSFVLAILVGGVLLWLPASARGGRMALVDALFTATSAVCVTGLVVVDTATAFSGFGQAVILALIQLGGLGIMTFSSLILLVAGGRVSLKDRLTVQASFRPSGGGDFRSLMTNIFVFTAALEAAGTLSLFLRFRRDFPPPRALVLSAFHAISAFCNAGFSLFSDNLMAYRGDWTVNVTVMLLIVLGGLGFFVLREITRGASAVLRRRRFRFSLHSKLVFVMTAALILISAGLLFWLEHSESMSGYSLREKALSATFQVVTARTAGFNTVNLAAYTSASAYLLILLMFVGASPGSTGGGVKTSTVGVILAFLRSKIRARESTSLFRRTVPADDVTKAYTVISLAMSLVFAVTFVMLLDQPGLGLKEVLFEVFSAFGTVGLSLGITPELTWLNKAALILTMYVGRVGPVTLLYAFSRYRAAGRFEYAEESVMIG
ncbi:MAG TPA: TrkH family potassium uptake protein [Acidobacteriota bacterium]|nr:TrkH family potassium uptake protein [Acidobacteriota bacterium]